MGRPEFEIKFRMAGLHDLPRTFPGQTSMWEMTAAQRALMLGPDKRSEKAAPTGKREPRILSMEEMQKRTKAREAQILEQDARREARKNEAPRHRRNGRKPPTEAQ